MPGRELLGAEQFQGGRVQLDVQFGPVQLVEAGAGARRLTVEHLAHLVQVSAILRHPVFVDGRNYSGTPGMVKLPFLREQVLRYFAHEAAQLPDALYIPMGGSVAEGLDWLAREGVIRRDRILHGLPHPSGANAERVAYFLGRKERAALSSRTNARQIDAARSTLLAQMAALGEE